ncbi:MAG TPA: hypothetical protein VK915_10360 [Gaiellaceae bacterium]|nr:hypothetical protein [Gaiellaceae bacterium]
MLHEHIGEPAGEQVREKLVELVRMAPLAFPLGDDDPAHRRVAGTRDPEPGGDGAEQAPRLGVRHAEGVEDAQRLDELTVDGRVEGHGSSLERKSSCV